MSIDNSTSGDLPAMQSLSYADRWRAAAYARKGLAPTDPRLAAATAEWARSYLGYGHRRLIDVLTAVGLVIFPAATVFFIVEDNVLSAIATGIVTLVHLAQVALTPVFRSGNVQRSLEACERVIGSSYRGED